MLKSTLSLRKANGTKYCPFLLCCTVPTCSTWNTDSSESDDDSTPSTAAVTAVFVLLSVFFLSLQTVWKWLGFPQQ